jgi:hypothetical protein
MKIVNFICTPNPKPELKTEIASNTVSGDNPNLKPNPVKPENLIGCLKPKTNYYMAIQENNKEFLATHDICITYSHI